MRPLFRLAEQGVVEPFVVASVVEAFEAGVAFEAGGFVTEPLAHIPDLSIKWRVELCQKAGVNIFAARHDWIPQDDCGYIFDECRPQ